MNEHTKPPDIFLSYARNKRDTAMTRRIREDLRKEGFSVWMDETSIPGGAEWERAIRRGIRDAKALVCIVSPETLSSSGVRAEIVIAQTYQKPIYPFWIAGEIWIDCAPFDIIVKQYFDARDQQYETAKAKLLDVLRATIPGPMPGPLPEPPKEVKRLKKITQFIIDVLPREKRLAPSPKPHPKNTENPYKGLFPFDTGDASFFFGRAALINTMIERISAILDPKQELPPMLTIIGTSGSGKSSVVRAGLLPRLQGIPRQQRTTARSSRAEKSIPGSQNWIYLDPLKPGSDPLDALAVTLTAYIQSLSPLAQSAFIASLQDTPVSEEPETKLREFLYKKLTGDSASELLNIALKLIEVTGKTRVVLFIDQLEELFSETSDTRLQQQFITLLLAGSRSQEKPLLVISTLRTDFLQRIMSYRRIVNLDAAFPSLFNAINASALYMQPMNQQELREAIERPAEQCGVSIEPALVGDLILDAFQYEDTLPLLQFTLQKLFERKENKQLTAKTYYTVKGKSSALNEYATGIYEQLGPEEKKQAETVFKHLIRIENTEGNIASSVTCRRVPTSELAHLKPIYEQFRDAGLLTVSQESGMETIQIVHEALIREWQTLAEWIKNPQMRLDVQKRALLIENAREWDEYEKTGKVKEARAVLYDRSHLKDVQWLEKWIAHPQPISSFLQASHAQVRKRTAFVSLVVALTAVIVLILGYLVLLRPSLPPLTVTTNEPRGEHSLSEELNNAPPGETIEVESSLKGETIVLVEDLVFKKNVEIKGNGVVLSSAHPGIKIHILPEVSVILDNVEIKGNHVDQNGVVYNQGYLTLKNCEIDGNHSDYNGGALVNAGGNLIIDHSSIHNNTANGSGGAIYNWNGTTIIDNGSTLFRNTAAHYGGAMYSLRGQASILDSTVRDNASGANDNGTYFGGGICMQNAILNLRRSTVYNNKVFGNGGGIAIIGNVATLDSSTIEQNTAITILKNRGSQREPAGGQGGGLAIERNSENGYPAQVVVINMDISDTTQKTYHIAHNYVQQIDGTRFPQKPEDNVSAPGYGAWNIAGEPIATDDHGKITLEGNRYTFINKNGLLTVGNPPPQGSSPEQRADIYLGTIDIDAFCQSKGYRQGEPARDITSNILCQSRFGGNASPEESATFLAKDACKWYYHYTGDDIIDRLADYYDSSSWQCYHGVELIERYPDGRQFSITSSDALARFCKSIGYIGLKENNARKTAYEWKCESKAGEPIGLSVTDACRFLTGYPDAFDRLRNFADPNGWECWQPIPKQKS